MRNESADELSQAETMFRRREFAVLVRHLEPQVFLYRNDPRYYYLLGVACLYKGDFSAAHSYLLRGADLDADNLNIRLALALTHLSRKEDSKALEIWLAIKDAHPRNGYARKGLELLKNAGDKSDWPRSLRDGKLTFLYPKPGPDWRRILRFGGLGFASAAVLFALLGAVLLIIRFASNAGGSAAVVTQALQSPAVQSASPAAAPDFIPSDEELADAKNARFHLGESDAVSLRTEATSAFRAYRDNRVRVLVNRVMQSDADLRIKIELRNLLTHVSEPGFVNFRDNNSFSDIAGDPILYQGSYVLWRGKVANVQKLPDKITFDFFVGYDSSPAATGKVAVALGFATLINNGDAVELIGQVIPNAQAEAGFTLRGTSIRMIKATK